MKLACRRDTDRDGRDDEDRLHPPFLQEAERRDPLEWRPSVHGPGAGTGRALILAPSVVTTAAGTTRSPASRPSRISALPALTIPTFTGWRVARLRSTFMTHGLPPVIPLRHSAGKTSHFDVDRNCHILAEIGGRVGHPQLDFDRGTLQVDTRVDVDHLRRKSLLWERIGRCERLLADGH
jgi:hypothetical protein